MTKTVSRLPQLLFLAVLILFSVLVFNGLSDQGLLYHDAGLYLLETKFIQEGVSIFLDLMQGGEASSGFWDEIKTQTTGVPIHTGKPGYNTVLWLFSFVIGFKDTLSCTVTAIAGMLNLLLVFLIGRRLSHALTGLYAVALLTASSFFLVFSRSALPDQIVTFSFLLGLYFYGRFRHRQIMPMLLAGLCFGFAFACNQWRVSYIAALLVLVDFLYLLKEQKSWIKIVPRTIFLGIGYVFFMILFQLPYIALKALVGELPFTDYWQQLTERMTTLGGVTWFFDVTELTREYVAVEGLFFPILVGAAWVFLIVRGVKNRNPNNALLVLFSLVPFIYFSGLSWGGMALPRVTSVLLPIAALCVGEGIACIQIKLLDKPRIKELVKHFATFGVVILLILPALPRQWALSNVGSGYRQASQYLKQSGEKKFMILSLEPVWRFYLGRVAHEPYDRPQSAEALLQEAARAGIRYVIVDFSSMYSKYGLEYTRTFPVHSKPVAKFDNSRGGSLPYLLDIFGLEKSLKISKNPHSAAIYIFDTLSLRAS